MMRVIVGTPQKRSSLHGSDSFLQDSSASLEEIVALAQTSTLLGEPHSYTFTGALSADRGEEFIKAAKIFVESSHTFIFTEVKLLKKTTDALTKAGADVTINAAPKKEAAFNIFSLTAAFAVHDRKKLWILLTQALRAGVAPEAIAGILHWKVRDQLSKTPTANAAHTDLVSLSRRIVTIYHDSHRGAGDLSLLLERFILLL
jgi:hypothetical protein